VIKFLELPGIRQVADIFFLRVLRRVASEQGALLAYGVDDQTAKQRHYAESVLARHPSIRAMANDRILFNDAGRSIDRRLGEVDVPTLIVHGTDDVSVPIRNGRRIAEAIPGAEFREVAADHVLPGKFSDVVVAAAADFIAADTIVS
jgi:pimeloyl-ACP methyl ester carboxylesterase